MTDHRALFEACTNYEEVVVVFVFDKVILKAIEDRADRRVTFIMRSLIEIDEGLKAYGSSIVVLYGDPTEEIPELALKLNADAVVTAHDFEPYALKRDTAVRTKLGELGIAFETVKDQVVFEQGEILSKTGGPFRVFTPYSRRWLELYDDRVDAIAYDPDLSMLAPSSVISKYSIGLEFTKIGFEACSPWLEAGEQAAAGALADFEERIDQYGEARDVPSLAGTSFLSVHLRFGTISIREAVRAALRHDSLGAKKWLTELIWREFYQDVLANSPQVVSTTFEPMYANIVWPGTDAHFEAWKTGQTGYPLVDAAMRCFAETGWMHNRLRMIVASFLTKDLLVNYKKGEAYFASQLLDFDLASNNGGWQWAASVGCDAQPYFRIFNPYLQSQKFDSKGAFIRRWLPELADLDNKSIHCPSPFDCELCGYPMPIVEHDIQRKLAIALFAECRSTASSL